MSKKTAQKTNIKFSWFFDKPRKSLIMQVIMKFGPHLKSMQDKLANFQHLISDAIPNTKFLLYYILTEELEYVPINKLNNSLRHLDPSEDTILKAGFELINAQQNITRIFIPKIFQILLYPDIPFYYSDIVIFNIIKEKNELWNKIKTLDRIPWILQAICLDILKDDLCGKNFLYKEVLFSAKSHQCKLKNELGDECMMMIKSALLPFSPKRFNEVGEFTFTGTELIFTPFISNIPSMSTDKLIIKNAISLRKKENESRADISGSGGHSRPK